MTTWLTVTVHCQVMDTGFKHNTVKRREKKRGKIWMCLSFICTISLAVVCSCQDAFTLHASKTSHPTLSQSFTVYCGVQCIKWKCVYSQTNSVWWQRNHSTEKLYWEPEMIFGLVWLVSGCQQSALYTARSSTQVKEMRQCSGAIWVEAHVGALCTCS